MGKQRFKLIIIAAVILLIISIVGGLYLFTDLFRPRNTKGVLLSAKTNEETVYSMEIIKKDDLKNKVVKNWLNGKTEENIQSDTDYYTLTGDRNFPFEMYFIFHRPRAQ